MNMFPLRSLLTASAFFLLAVAVVVSVTILATPATTASDTTVRPPAITYATHVVKRVAERVTPAPRVTPVDPAAAWLGSAGGQAQVTFNDDVAVLAGDLKIESLAPTVANHLVFEADARTMRAEADKILTTRALLPTVGKTAYERMLNDFITVADMLQPGPDYGTTSQDYAAWYKANTATDINVS